jgi:hypothetical protein
LPATKPRRLVELTSFALVLKQDRRRYSCDDTALGAASTRRRVGDCCSLMQRMHSISRTGQACCGLSGTSGRWVPGWYSIVTNTGPHSCSKATMGLVPSYIAMKASPKETLSPCFLTALSPCHSSAYSRSSSCSGATLVCG